MSSASFWILETTYTLHIYGFYWETWRSAGFEQGPRIRAQNKSPGCHPSSSAFRATWSRESKGAGSLSGIEDAVWSLWQPVWGEPQCRPLEYWSQFLLSSVAGCSPSDFLPHFQLLCLLKNFCFLIVSVYCFLQQFLNLQLNPMTF